MARTVSIKEKRIRIAAKVNASLRSIRSTEQLIMRWPEHITAIELQQALGLLRDAVADIESAYKKQLQAKNQKPFSFNN